MLWVMLKLFPQVKRFSKWLRWKIVSVKSKEQYKQTERINHYLKEACDLNIIQPGANQVPNIAQTYHICYGL